jgi:hypothetical protein
MSEAVGVEKSIDGVAATGVSTPIELYHFTPFASLLYHLPTAVREVFGDSQIYWSHNDRAKCLEVDIYWTDDTARLPSGKTWTFLTSVIFDRTAYSYGQIVDTLTDAKAEAIV